jgi:endonuclease/exonuclease/phosphatase family metal-dependent hydrolase
MSHSLKIVTYNIHKGVSAFGRSVRIHAIKEALDALDADLIFLQEVQGRHDLHEIAHAQWPSAAQHDYLAGASHQAAYGMNAVYDHGHHGNALLSRFPISTFTNHDVSDHAYEQRGILHAITQIEGRDVHCFVMHLGLFAVSRRRQIIALIAEIKRSVPADAPVIIAGDFNDWSLRLSQRLYEELGVTEAFDASSTITLTPPAMLAHPPLQVRANFKRRLSQLRALLLPTQLPFKFKKSPKHARSFPSAVPFLSLDRVYVRGLVVREAKVLTGAPWRGLSDHVPLTVSLAFANPVAE